MQTGVDCCNIKLYNLRYVSEMKISIKCRAARRVSSALRRAGVVRRREGGRRRGASRRQLTAPNDVSTQPRPPRTSSPLRVMPRLSPWTPTLSLWYKWWYDGVVDTQSTGEDLETSSAISHQMKVSCYANRRVNKLNLKTDE